MSEARENTTPDATDAAQARPFLRIVKGNPDDTQVAALTTVFAGLASAAAAEASKEKRDRNLWGNYAERLQKQQLYNPNAFRNVTYY